MTGLYVRSKNGGFSLVELMVVVAIIGTLASIAVPAFDKFAAKSRQTEAKMALSNLYASEDMVHGEWNTYTSSFKVMSIDISGHVHYRYGFWQPGGDFASTTANGLPSNFNGTQGTGNDMNSAWYCNVSFPTECTCDAGCIIGLDNNSFVTANTFVSQARSYIGSDATVMDEFKIDQNKQLVNSIVGY